MVDQDRIGQIADEVVASYYEFRRDQCYAPRWSEYTTSDSKSLYRQYTLPIRPPRLHSDLAFAFVLTPEELENSEDFFREKFHSDMRKIVSSDPRRNKKGGELNG